MTASVRAWVSGAIVAVLASAGGVVGVGVVLGVGAGVGGCAAHRNTPANTVVTGNVMYLERIMLPPETQARIRLVDVTDSRAPKTVAEFSEKVGGKVPIPFRLAPGAWALREDRIYQVRAELIMPGGRKWGHFESYPVLTGGSPGYVEIRVYPMK
jgi:putative lipoprotein